MIILRHLTFIAVFFALAPLAAAQPEQPQQDLLEYGVWLDYNSGLRNLNIRSIAVDPGHASRLYAGARGILYRSLNGGMSWEIVYNLRASGQRSVGEVERRTYDVGTIEDLTDDQLQEVNDLFEELEQDQYIKLEEEYGEYLATLILDELQDDLLEQALEEILSQEAATAGPREIAPEAADPLRDNVFTQILVDPRETNQVYAVAGQGIYRSQDYGASWELISLGVGRTEERFTSLALGEGTLVVGTTSGALVSLDNGASWERIPGPPSSASIAFVASSPTYPQYLYLVGDGRLYRSRDGGRSWLPRTVLPAVRPGEINNLVIDPDNSNRLLVATASGVQETNDGGDAFRLIASTGLRDRNVRWLALYRSALVVGTEDGIYSMSGEAGVWLDLDQGLPAATIYQVAVGPDDHIWIASGQGIYQLMHPWEMISGQEQARRASEMFAAEPDLGRTLAAVLTYYGYHDLPVDSWATRLWWSRFLPTVRVEYRVDQQRRETADYVYDSAGLSNLDGLDLRRQDDGELRVMGLVDLYDLVMEPREMSVRQEGEQLVKRRSRLVRRLLRLYTTRQNLVMRIAEGRNTTIARVLMDQMVLAELTARLDAMSGGFFSAYSRIAGR
ncbi:MAG: hypothetical protein JW797_18230 [Bradymonadales bacterium]|nr:hypothetical protein [Bradymonadales bacterium]